MGFRLKPMQISTDNTELEVCAALDKNLSMLMVRPQRASSTQDRTSEVVAFQEVHFRCRPYIELALNNYRARLLEYYVKANKAPTKNVESPPLPDVSLH